MLQTLKDVVATVDYKLPRVKGTTLNTKYEAGPKVYTVGATWDGKVANKAVTQKVTFSNKDNKVAGEESWWWAARAGCVYENLMDTDHAFYRVLRVFWHPRVACRRVSNKIPPSHRCQYQWASAT